MGGVGAPSGGAVDGRAGRLLYPAARTLSSIVRKASREAVMVASGPVALKN